MKGMPRDEAAAFLKLPKWAQSRIILLIRERDEAIARFAEVGRVMEQFEDLKPGIGYGDWQRTIEIPKDDKVTFWLADGREIDVRLTDDYTGLYLLGSDRLQFSPSASNTATLTQERDRVREKLLQARADKIARNILLRRE
jgi:hypothetical protein